MPNDDITNPVSSESSSSSSTPNSQACAACKHQRRRCTSQCILARYFPSSRMQDFLNVHKHFGVSKVNKNLESVKESDRQRTAECMIYEANARSVDPVLGCAGIIRQLEKELSVLEMQLKFVVHELSRVKSERPTSGKENSNPNNSNDGGGGFVFDYGIYPQGMPINQNIKCDPFANLASSSYLKGNNYNDDDDGGEDYGEFGKEESEHGEENAKQNLEKC